MQFFRRLKQPKAHMKIEFSGESPCDIELKTGSDSKRPLAEGKGSEIQQKS